MSMFALFLAITFGIIVGGLVLMAITLAGYVMFAGKFTKLIMKNLMNTNFDA